jgi:hypothetical protein
MSGYAKQPDPAGQSRSESAEDTGQQTTLIDAIMVAAGDLADRFSMRPEEREPLSVLTRRVREENALGLLDVQSAIEHYDHQEAALEQLGRGFPCAQVEGDVPLPISVIPAVYPTQSRPLVGAFFDLLAEATDAFTTSADELTEHDLGEARGFLRERLSSFLAFRLLGLTSNPPPGGPPGSGPPSGERSPGLPFRVETPGRDGLKILYSPAYFRVTHQFGNTLSTPVESWMRPGRWIFGVRDGADGIKWVDDVVYDIPGDTDVVQL